MIWTIFVLISISIFAQAKAQNLTPKPANQQQLSEISNSVSDGGKDAKIVENWINLSSQFNDRILAAVYWALGTVVAVLIFIVGGSWFVNFRAYERDKIALITDLNKNLAEQISAIRLDLQKSHEAQEKSINKLVINTVETKLDLLAKENSATNERLIGIKKGLDYEISKINLELKKNEAKYWEEQGTKANAVGLWTEVGDISSRLGIFYETENALERIEDLLSKGARGAFDHNIAPFLENLPGKHDPVKKRIINLLTSPS